MSLTSWFRWLLGRPADIDPEATDGPADAAIAVLEAPSESPSSYSEGAAWWVPRGPPTLAPPEPHVHVRSLGLELYECCVRALDDPNVALPQVPQVTQQVLLLLRGENADLRRAAEVAERDPALTAGILRLANSAAYAGVTPINQLNRAFARLGQRTLRSLLLASTVKEVAIRVGGPQRTLGEELWRRSLASGIILASLSAQYGLPDDEAFLVGLLHDIGMLALLKLAHDARRDRGGKIAREAFDLLCREWHEHMGLRLADAWNLPDPLPEIIANHHREPAADDPLATYRSLVALADVICALLEYAPYVPYDFFRLACVRRLGLQDDPATRRWLTALPNQLGREMDLF